MELYAVINEERKLTESNFEIVSHALADEGSFLEKTELDGMNVGELRVIYQTEMDAGFEMRQLIMRVL